jgi:hypothetical protein
MNATHTVSDAMRPKHTEPGTIEGEPTDIGRDPRQMSREDMIALGHQPLPLLDIIRANCIECCGGMQAEVRRCRMVACPMWPYRMATNPLREKITVSEEVRQSRIQALAAARDRKKTLNETGETP